METTLQNIEKFLAEYTPMQYAKKRVESLTDMDLDILYSAENTKGEKLKDIAFSECLKQYAENVIVLAGFFEMGKVFVLNKREKYISFIAQEDKKKKTITLVTNYNPYGVDCIEENMSADRLFMDTDRHEFSLNEARLIKELHATV